MARRTRYEVVADILRMDGVSKTQVMYGSNLTHALTRKYLAKLEARGLVETKEHGKSMIYYPTERGRGLLVLVDRVVEELGWEVVE